VIFLDLRAVTSSMLELQGPEPEMLTKAARGRRPHLFLYSHLNPLPLSTGPAQLSPGKQGKWGVGDK
jgi:hypothetical protein